MGHYPNTGVGLLGVFLVNVDTETSYNIDQNGHDLGQSIWVLVVEQ